MVPNNDQSTGPRLRLLRWLLLLPAVFLAWQISLLTGIAIFAVAESFCPQEQMVSDLCTAPWFRWAEAGVFMFGAALAATLMILTAVWLAPSHRTRVAWSVFIAGFLLAGYLGLATQAWAPFTAAVVAGSVTLSLVIRRQERST